MTARRYDTSIDRAGLALGAGSLLVGCVALILVLLGGERAPLALLGSWALATLFAGLGIAALGGPLWLVLHVAGLRRMRHAALAGAAVALALFVGAQTYGFGLFEMPEMDSRTWLFRWLSAATTSVILAGIAAAIGAAMWRIAYRPYYAL